MMHHALLRLASLLVPGGQRAGWLQEWRSELWYVPRREATRFCLGAFRDALWVMMNNPRPVPRLESPLSCLGLLSLLAAASAVIAVRLPAPHTMTSAPHLTARDLPIACIPMLTLTALLLPAVRLAMMRARASRLPVAWPAALRRGIYFALKIALLQPILLAGFMIQCLLGPVPVVPLAVCAFWILAFRWALIDQRRRCPVCLRLLTNPVRIGDSSHTFLAWYGDESMCSRGHGLLHVPELTASYSGKQEWLKLDASWSGLFSERS